MFKIKILGSFAKRGYTIIIEGKLVFLVFSDWIELFGLISEESHLCLGSLPSHKLVGPVENNGS